MRKLIKILDVHIDQANMSQSVKRIRELIADHNQPSLIVTPNSEMLAMAAENSELARILNSADLATPDGIGVVIASKILGQPLEERVAGFDLISNLFKEFAGEEINFYFLGSKPGIVDQAVENLKKDYPNLNILGYHHGYINRDDQQKIIADINSKNIDLLLVGMGVPLQERFLDNNLKNLKVGAAVTVGGSFDVLAGKVNRAPLWMQKAALEWFYRLLQEPSRFGRMLALPKFIFLVLKSKYLK
ncbi:MAG: N-acetylglucosaminyldiphosphoundecaprenol [Halanaerobium sp. 4-GBenrich]|uniref:N-acetylglucosaminyldiphosphoundecaprenol N-acetyl-beta-D-mannosaminyltransferase n=1 Tax=Halanaerobium congolense TaxID=54121 RepID=A0A1G6RV72_9FIRM|nr:WecB/TagA/CpsF family glycosyltransferase [Halanaerobium congolense]ODS50627.1 MAG: N-acetylglucosaminyldiphosphoundecaprenol [Halanaerobium sp. 4-GBenrich]OEG62228.1 MAG: N-acetylmannosaminyltransferase [Halanaerobium sp. MDAL1]PUU91253.1 MAG: N-acetylglucosaminyldiphosphoundecaprenol [Halanaerobium sp.]PTX15766.1 N-acetylmannosaminyltransferase [Halanaerobium congolense]PXV70011.1 N-acetylmannosaminyltransferase [Halanaerobium congolense]